VTTEALPGILDCHFCLDFRFWGLRSGRYTRTEGSNFIISCSMDVNSHLVCSMLLPLFYVKRNKPMIGPDVVSSRSGSPVSLFLLA
jgi:hypothetical protein